MVEAFTTIPKPLCYMKGRAIHGMRGRMLKVPIAARRMVYPHCTVE